MNALLGRARQPIVARFSAHSAILFLSHGKRLGGSGDFGVGGQNGFSNWWGDRRRRKELWAAATEREERRGTVTSQKILTKFGRRRRLLVTLAVLSWGRGEKFQSAVWNLQLAREEEEEEKRNIKQLFPGSKDGEGDS